MTISNDDDFLNATCKSHTKGGRAASINCYECLADYRDDEAEPVADDEE